MAEIELSVLTKQCLGRRLASLETRLRAQDLRLRLARAGDRIMLLINGCGATTLMEMYIVLRGCKKYLDSKGISIAAARCGELLTVQEMAGFQMFAAKLDDEMLACWNAPCNTPALTVA